MDIKANCICEIHFLALDGFDFNTVHKIKSNEMNSQRDKKSPRSRDSNLGLQGGKQESFLCATQLPIQRSVNVS